MRGAIEGCSGELPERGRKKALFTPRRGSWGGNLGRRYSTPTGGGGIQEVVVVKKESCGGNQRLKKWEDWESLLEKTQTRMKVGSRKRGRKSQKNGIWA